MRFKVWLENDNFHSILAWYKEYGQTQKKRGKSGDPKLRNDPRVRDVSAVMVLEVAGSTSGHDRTPAVDPWLVAEKRVLITPQQEQVLMGLPAFVSDRSGGSYHERWLKIEVGVIVNTLFNDDWELPLGLEYTNIAGDLDHLAGFFQYQGVEHALEFAENIQSNRFDPRSDESPEQYWARVRGMKKSAPPPPTFLNPYDTYRGDSDNYFKRKV